MREPKYQAWLEDEKAMVQVTSLNLIKNTSGEYEYQSTGFYLSGYGKFVGTGFVLSEAKLREYTGLKDKNGVEIYEGDVIDDHIGKGIVEYIRAAYRINYGNGTCKWFMDYLKSEFETIEVIGNKFEHPHLINKDI